MIGAIEFIEGDIIVFIVFSFSFLSSILPSSLSFSVRFFIELDRQDLFAIPDNTR
jgi:hypothetical protein